MLTTWLKYWHNALVDIDRQSAEVKADTSIELPGLQADPEKLRGFYTVLHKNLFPEGPVTAEEPEPLEVAISSFALYPAAPSNYRATSRNSKPLYPFWIPARLTKTGQLMPPAGNQPAVPWLVRDVLEPTIKDNPTLATIEQVDQILATWKWQFDSWEIYWANAQAFLEKVTSLSGWRKDLPQSGGWTTNPEFVITQANQTGTAINLLKLYEYLTKQSTLPPLLTTLIQGRNVAPTVNPNDPAILLVKGHYGQMSGAFPLSPSQRTTLQLFQTTGPGDVFPVNGPPGTGKTTLLQSIVANLLVEKAVLGQDAPLILASSTNNQAITNILDSFGKDAPLERWLPDMASLGLYLTNKKEELVKHYQVDGKYVKFYKDKETPEYLQKAQAELLRKGAAQFRRAYATVESLRDDLHASLKNKVEKTAAWLNLLPNLRDQHGRPWNRLGLDAHQQALQTQVVQLEAFRLAIARLQASESGFDRLLSWLFPWFRRSQQAKYKLLVLEQCPYNEQVSNYEPESLGTEVSHRMDAVRQQLQKCRIGLASLANFDKLLAQFRQDYAGNKKVLDLLQLVTPDTFNHLHDALDISYRYEAFKFSLHYWEARYVLALRAKRQAPPTGHPQEEKVAEKFGRWAMLTPCFISTFHSVPGRVTDKNKDKELSYPLQLFDLLLVDEAGQVSPEVGVPAFALAKKAIVVGDTQQIEPVWGMGTALDSQNMHRVKINSDEDFVAYRVSSGSIMHMAQLASPIQLCSYSDAEKLLPERGLLLRQHRRCKPGIIDYCNRFVYDRQLEILPPKPVFDALGLPPLGYIHINGECLSVGTSRQNLDEAEAIARWVLSNKEDILRVAKQRAQVDGAPAPTLKSIIGIVTPFSSQKNAIKQALQALGLAKEDITVGTVHALQGAERAIVLFSPVYDNPGGSFFFDQGYNLLNVALSRAKEIFLVVGNRCLFNPSLSTPSGNLAKLLFAAPTSIDQTPTEVSNSFFYNEYDNEQSDKKPRRKLPIPVGQLAVLPDKIHRLNTLLFHRNALKRAFQTAQTRLVIVSPFISSRAIQDDDVAQLITDARTRCPNLQIVIYTDAYLDAPAGKLSAWALAGRKALTDAGAQVRVVAQIHNKTICIDGTTLIEGSFNWLSASRDVQRARHEVSWIFTGSVCQTYTDRIIQEMEARIKSRV